MFLGDWAGCSETQIFTDFEYYVSDNNYNYSKYNGVQILFAYYLYEDYSGEAFVLFRKDGQLYEVNASHCSCYALEGQWDPEETTIEALQHRLNDGYFGRTYSYGSENSNTFGNELKKMLDFLHLLSYNKLYFWDEEIK